ncbi:MAG TPA: Sir2 family NAD-dependent protein deacetylase [Chitinophagaceae bacterium]|nr:Sir2 family NAD-dependent protein deacetylase [Chitinophagaceae bacterium]HNF71115.1 Sir2 family NAD-dependent protein deacetylase [Chitinophagaceae bacterium]
MKIVVFTGAGMSAESGIQTFRDSGGLWEGYRVEDVAHPLAWKRNPEQVLRFYNERRRKILEAVPNEAHYYFAQLQEFHSVQIITQNIDDLHERAGSKRVWHLHGEILKKRSERNPNRIEEVRGDMIPGERDEEGALWRPHIVWFDEPVPAMEKAIAFAQEADLFIVVGSSLQVYPAASLLHYIRDTVPVVVIDRKIPRLMNSHVVAIELPATQGVVQLHEWLTSFWKET